MKRERKKKLKTGESKNECESKGETGSKREGMEHVVSIMSVSMRKRVRSTSLLFFTRKRKIEICIYARHSCHLYIAFQARNV